MERWICFLGFLRVTSCLTNVLYNLHSKEASFDQALKTCQLDGYLTDMAEEEEAKNIISLIEGRINHAGTHQFWMGLRKTNTECILNDLPLKGFKWTVSDSSETNVSKWKKTPDETCTSVLCGLLTVDYKENTVTDWGWIGSSCREEHPFICRVNKQMAETSQPECEKPTIFQALKLLKVEHNPLLLEVHCPSNDTFILTCSPGNKEWMLGSGSGDITEICLACNPGYTRSDMGSCIDINECAKKPCESGCTNTEGSYVCTCDAAMGYEQSEDSKSCKKLLSPTEAPASSTTTVQSLPPTHPTPQATNGKGSTVTLPPGPAPTTGSSVNLETSEAKFSIWIPVVAAVLALLFLVVIALIIVKCCRRKRSKKLSKEKGGKWKETVVLKAADSLEEINQKEIV
ncbi:C-type lectin domain family 14 member A [Conger conger]|uniref:C-type lectin domain family 14 member A n=1 Tax=Conger conger TaxID=82655 RepID=UPI002A5A94F8|nr:C-type lectin domain family 14 member A [Conger conger]